MAHCLPAFSVTDTAGRSEPNWTIKGSWPKTDDFDDFNDSNNFNGLMHSMQSLRAGDFYTHVVRDPCKAGLPMVLTMVCSETIFGSRSVHDNKLIDQLSETSLVRPLQSAKWTKTERPACASVSKTSAVLAVIQFPRSIPPHRSAKEFHRAAHSETTLAERRPIHSRRKQTAGAYPAAASPYLNCDPQPEPKPTKQASPTYPDASMKFPAARHFGFWNAKKKRWA